MYHISREVGLEVNFREDCVQMGGIILYRERISEAVFQMYDNIHSGSLELDFRGLKNDQSDKVVPGKIWKSNRLKVRKYISLARSVLP